LISDEKSRILLDSNMKAKLWLIFLIASVTLGCLVLAQRREIKRQKQLIEELQLSLASSLAGTWSDDFSRCALGPDWTGNTNDFWIADGVLHGVSANPLVVEPPAVVEVGNGWSNHVVSCSINIISPTRMFAPKGRRSCGTPAMKDMCSRCTNRPRRSSFIVSQITRCSYRRLPASTISNGLMSGPNSKAIQFHLGK
jgi:hypothetical protein